MKIEKIEMNKIKVTVSAMDLVNMNINVKSLKPDSPHLHDFLFEVMEQVRKETGFNPYAGQVVVEATPSDGGIILTVTRVSEETPMPKRPKGVRVVGHRSPKKLTYKFASFDDLCELFTVADSVEFEKAALYEYMQSFFLSLPRGTDLPITEYATLAYSQGLNENFLAEHGKLCAEGEELVKMAEGVKRLEQK